MNTAIYMFVTNYLLFTFSLTLMQGGRRYLQFIYIFAVLIKQLPPIYINFILFGFISIYIFSVFLLKIGIETIF
ncbi:hypothetical protein CsatB_026483 [Cannabis sativa]